jgi:hypothetical protein
LTHELVSEPLTTDSRFYQISSQSEVRFKKLTKIHEEEQITIIETGFPLTQSLNLSFKEYCEGNET